MTDKYILRRELQNEGKYIWLQYDVDFGKAF